MQFKDFMKLSDFFFVTIGIEPYVKPGGLLATNQSSWKKNLIFSMNLLNMNWILFSEVLFIVLAVLQHKNFVEATMTLVYVGFVSAGDLKMLSVWRKKQHLTQFINDLYELFPRDPEEQLAKYDMKKYLRQCTALTIGFSLMYMLLIWTYNLFAMFEYLIYDALLQKRVIEPELPYFMYIAWDWRNNWSYYLLYASQVFAGYTSAAGQISSDLLLCSAATQMVMHYDYLARTLTEYKVKFENEQNFKTKQEDMQFLAYIVAYHDKVLRLVQESFPIANIFFIENLKIFKIF